MAQYQRFLSYLFGYENDVKGENCGFAKIEVRGDVKRIQITVKGRSPVELLHVCGFYRDNGRCVCVPLGRMMINGGNGQFQYVTGGSFLRGSQIPFEQLSGLVLSSPQEKGRAYATVWDDDPFGLSMFEQPQEETELQQMSPEMSAERVMEQLEMTDRAAGRWTEVENDTEDAWISRKDAAEGIEKTHVHQRESVGRGEEGAMGLDCAAGRGEEGALGLDYAVGRDEEESLSLDCAAMRDEEGSMGLDCDAVRGEEGSMGLDCAVGRDEEESLSLDCAAMRDEEGSIGLDCTAERNGEGGEVQDTAADELWLKLCRRFRRIESLAGSQITCLRAVPADLGRLPRANWIYGNNGFLMYSYVRYRYLVFARLSEQEYELWLPGTYHKNEELLAEMFGFARFRSMKSAKPETGDFGYWCVPLFMPGCPVRSDDIRAASAACGHNRNDTKEGEQEYDRTGTAEAG